MFVELVLGCLAILFIWDFITKKHRNDVFAKYRIPGPKTLPILGNSLDIRHINTESKYHTNKVEKFGRKK